MWESTEKLVALIIFLQIWHHCAKLEPLEHWAYNLMLIVFNVLFLFPKVLKC
jgi:hypothetical protein